MAIIEDIFKYLNRKHLVHAHEGNSVYTVFHNRMNLVTWVNVVKGGDISQLTVDIFPMPYLDNQYDQFVVLNSI